MQKHDLFNTKWSIWFLTKQDVLLNKGCYIKHGNFRVVSNQDQSVLNSAHEFTLHHGKQTVLVHCLFAITA